METEFRKRGCECGSFKREEKKLELSLAPPGGEDWIVVEEELKKPPFNLSSNCFSKIPKSDGLQREQLGPYQTHLRGMHASSERNSTQIRETSSPIVGWPPIRSSRKNIVTTSTKQPNELKNEAHDNGSKCETSMKSLFIKINMDGIPIGRKVDLSAYDNYQNLSSIVEELFSDLLAAQRDPTTSGNGVTENDRMAFTGLLDGSGEYTLVYEDNEGDRMMVGDVPWEMFVSTAKRLRVLRNSELSSLFLGDVNSKKAADCLTK